MLLRLPGHPGLPEVQLDHAHLPCAWHFRTDLIGANLDGATLTDARLLADLTDARLDGADLSTAKNLAQEQLDSARGDDETKLPAGLQRPAHWSARPAAPPTADP